VSAYLDHAATTPMRPEAIEAMLPFLDGRFANPSGAHRMARDARRSIDDARDVVAECSAVEHHAVLDPVVHLGGRTVGVDASGRLDLDHLAAVLEDESDLARSGEGAGVRLVSLMAANNEVGTIQPLAEAAEIVRRLAPDAVLHTDAVQAFCWTDVAALTSVADLVSLSAHKFGGPKGVGVLVVRDAVALTPRQLGGGQERGHRSGTQNVPGIVAAGVAARRSADDRAGEVERVGKLRDRLLDGLVASVPGLVETGAVDGPAGPDRSGRVAGTAHVCIEGVESEALLFMLEREQIYASAASSCSSGAMEPSHVLEARGVPADLRNASLRLSLGWSTTDAEIDHALAVIPPAVEHLRAGGL
jgi:cysteine desulfurase